MAQPMCRSLQSSILLLYDVLHVAWMPVHRNRFVAFVHRALLDFGGKKESVLRKGGDEDLGFLGSGSPLVLDHEREAVLRALSVSRRDRNGSGWCKRSTFGRGKCGWGCLEGPIAMKPMEEGFHFRTWVHVLDRPQEDRPSFLQAQDPSTSGSSAPDAQSTPQLQVGGAAKTCILFVFFTAAAVVVGIGALMVWHMRLIVRGETSIEQHINKQTRQRFEKEGKVRDLPLFSFLGERCLFCRSMSIRTISVGEAIFGDSSD